MVKPANIHRELDTRLAGLADAKRFISTRIALHIRRAVELAADEKADGRNQCILIMGPSGAGKTYLMEQAAAVAKLPFVCANAAALTGEGFMGTGVGDVLKMLLRKGGINGKLARFGICFLDEWDKRIQPRRDQKGFDHEVQSEVLRMMEGTMLEIETRRSSVPPVPFNTNGLMFIFAGAFEGLNVSPARRSGKVDGFAALQEGVVHSARDRSLHDALMEYGMMPEFINRLSGILTLPTPTVEDMVDMVHFEGGPLESCNRMLRSLGAELVADDAAVLALAEYACESRAYCRGIQLLLQAAADLLVYEGVEGQVALEADDVRRLIEGKPLLRRTGAGDVANEQYQLKQEA
jgi:ATP-dependent Clp protease ATP-binding subunit ClpX